MSVTSMSRETVKKEEVFLPDLRAAVDSTLSASVRRLSRADHFAPVRPRHSRLASGLVSEQSVMRQQALRARCNGATTSMHRCAFRAPM